MRDELLSIMSAFILAAVDAKNHVPIEFTCGCTSILGAISDIDCVWFSGCVSSFSGTLYYVRRFSPSVSRLITTYHSDKTGYLSTTVQYLSTIV